jgi:hypothetical protein
LDGRPRATAFLLQLSIAVLVSLVLGAGVKISSAIVAASAVGHAHRDAFIKPGGPSDTAAASASKPKQSATTNQSGASSLTLSTSHRFSQHLTWLGPQPPHRPASGDMFSLVRAF